MPNDKKFWLLIILCPATPKTLPKQSAVKPAETSFALKPFNPIRKNIGQQRHRPKGRLTKVSALNWKEKSTTSHNTILFYRFAELVGNNCARRQQFSCRLWPEGQNRYPVHYARGRRCPKYNYRFNCPMQWLLSQTKRLGRLWQPNIGRFRLAWRYGVQKIADITRILGKSSAKVQNFFYKKSFTYCQI